MRLFLTYTAVLLLVLQRASPFCPSPSSTVLPRHAAPPMNTYLPAPIVVNNNNLDLRSSTSARTTVTALSMSKTDGLEEGKAIFAIALVIAVWFFSIPTEFRRARLCSEADSAIYEQCLTPSQFATGVSEYYKNGGGIKFDFSIDPGTLEANEDLRQALFEKGLAGL